MRTSPRPIVKLCGLVVFLTASAVSADDPLTLPLHERIDRLVESGRETRMAPPATDGEFLRRVSVDLIGYPPSSTEARAFLDDPSPYKRKRLVEALLDSPEFARRMAVWLDITFMERRGDVHVPSTEWREYLYQSMLANKPYDVLVREILSSDGGDPTARSAAKFYLDRNGDPNVLTRDVGRIFLGRDMQCAQCHDHPLIDDYKQAHYYGLFAFFNRGQMAQDARGVMTFGEKADGDVSYSSVFKKKVTNTALPHVLDGSDVSETAAQKGQEYWSYPGDKNRVIPRYSRRAQLAARLAEPGQSAFSRNIANRVWAMLLGEGLVQPLDMHHSENPPRSPEVLDLLAAEFVALKFDLKALVSEIVLTRTYQRSSEHPEAPSSAEDEGRWPTAAVVRPLTPEQLGWSVMQATGVLVNYKSAAQITVIGSDPRLSQLLTVDEKRQRLRGELLERWVYAQLNPSITAFVQQFGGVAGQSQDKSQSTVHQALMLSNGEPIQSWLNPSGDNLTARLQKHTDPGALAEELYLSVLTRRPTGEERADVAAYLKSREPERDAAIRELAWALLTSSEFRFDH